MNRQRYIKLEKENQEFRKKVNSDPNRLKFHLMPPTGFLNDPNGLYQKDGLYHIYFQYTPFNPGWGLKTWGHYTSSDLISFKEEEPFLYPDIKEDKDGVYSGSAFIEDGKIHFFYTGNVTYKDMEGYDGILVGREQNTIKVTSPDGFNYDKKNIVLKNEDYPPYMSCHVRDPKIFKKDGKYYMAIGGRMKDDVGCLLLFKSKDLENFEFFDMVTTKEKFGYMWECPDLFELDGKLVLVTCPQGVEKDGYKYENVYQCGYFFLDYDFERKKYSLSEFKELDHGFDVYAPQSFLDEKGRRIQICWMGIPDAEYTNEQTVKYGWNNALSMPKELKIKNNKVIQKPIEEMKDLRLKEYSCEIEEFERLKIEDQLYEMKVDFERKEDFKLEIKKNVFLEYKENLLTLTMNESGFGRDKRHIEIEEIKNIRIFNDTSSIEIFINDGEEVMTSRAYTEKISKPKFITKNKGEIQYYPLRGYEYIK